MPIKGEAQMALSMILHGSLTDKPKEREDRDYKNTNRNDYGYVQITFGKYKGDKTIANVKSARTVDTFLKLAEQDNAMFFNPNTLRTASPEKRSNDAVRWINTVAIDIDAVDMSLDELLKNIEDVGLNTPTMVNKTPKGFHVYWILQERVPGYKSARALYSLISGLMCDVLPGADHGSKAVCSFKRIPRDIAYFDPEATCELRELQEWYNLNKKSTVKTRAFDRATGTGKNILDTTAAQMLLEGIHEGGRNLAAFCLAKLYRRAGLTYEETFEELLKWNTKNSPSLKVSELRSRVKSAFRNRDMIPSKLIKELTGESIAKELFWVNHARTREERKKDPKGRIHISEWIQDIENLVEKEGVWEGKQTELAALLEAPERSIKEALRQIRENPDSRVLVTSTIGRGAKTTLTKKDHVEVNVEDDEHVENEEQVQEKHGMTGALAPEKNEEIKGAQSLNPFYKGWWVGESEPPGGEFGSQPFAVRCGPSGACVQVHGFGSCAQIQKSTAHAPEDGGHALARKEVSQKVKQAKPLGYFNTKAKNLDIEAPKKGSGCSELVKIKVSKEELKKHYPDKDKKQKGWI
ncbi:primase C-terminal domain-containing protein [Fusibacter sp. JL216-2]|uniref:primase C-terminal domain-containing protein n=1 Tax=Fusibacter sp. JL216-2 TaxID=3071453 RepID=UPI003D3581CB